MSRVKYVQKRRQHSQSVQPMRYSKIKQMEEAQGHLFGDDYNYSTRYRDSQRYVDMDNNYQYMVCRNKQSNKGGASGDRVDRDHKYNSEMIKNYVNNEPDWQKKIKESYRKIF